VLRASIQKTFSFVKSQFRGPPGRFPPLLAPLRLQAHNICGEALSVSRNAARAYSRARFYSPDDLPA
jgi:hypothetical protein